MSSLRIVFAGSPDVAVPTLDALIASPHEVVTVVTRSDSPVGRRGVLTPTPVATRAASLGLPIIKSNRLDESATESIAASRPDLGVIVAYGGLVREPLLTTPRYGWINLHFSLLPRWRGAAPVQHAILAGDEETGISVFQLVPELDAGAVFSRVPEPIGRLQTSGALLSQLAMIGANELVRVVDAIADGSAVAHAQSGESTYAGKLTAADGVIDWTRPAVEIERRVRAVTPEPGASTTLDGQRFKILEVAPGRDVRALAPGEVVLDDRRVLVGTGDAAIELLRVTPFGKSPMSAADWVRGRPRGRETVFGV